MKTILGTYSNPNQHWVGDGFPVRSLFSYNSLGGQVSPFLLLDYAGPYNFAPTTDRRGVGQHPHRGFETVTIVYDGEVEHKDSTGNGGIIGPGDVQWMTAAGGILHEEYHSPAFAKTGGPFRMVQLGAKGPARTFTPINVWDVRLNRDADVTLDLPEGHTAMLVVLGGHVTVGGSEGAREAEMVLLSREGGSIDIRADGDATILVLTGEPIDEPIIGHGPFVMNSEAEIRQAIDDYNNGRLAPIAA